MALLLYYGSGSPFAWRVHLALHHKQVPFQLKLLSFSSGDLKKPEFERLNPRRKVPVIEDEGFALYESAAILEYLDERFPSGPSLFPGDVRGRALVRRLIREVDGYYYEPHERIFEQLFMTPPERRDAQLIESAKALCTEELAFYERALRGEFLAGELSAADFTLYPMVATIARYEKKQPDLGLSQAIGPKLSSWMKRIESLPYFGKTYPPHWRLS
jgi:glutathione S-transferase